MRKDIKMTGRIEFKRYKKGVDYSYTFGVFPTLELLLNKPEQVQAIIISPFADRNEGVDQIKQICKKRDIKLITNQKMILKLSKKENTLAIGKFLKYETNIEPNSNHIVLVNPSDAGNLGTIIRTMLGMDLGDLVIIRPGVDIFDPRVVRSTMGALFKINFTYLDNFEKYCEQYKHNLYPFMLQNSVSVKDVEFKKPYTLIFGKEGDGLPESFAHVGTPVRLKQSNEIDSYNLAISVALGMNEACK